MRYKITTITTKNFNSLEDLEEWAYQIEKTGIFPRENVQELIGHGSTIWKSPQAVSHMKLEEVE
jgi:hypothetical protein